MKLHHLLRPLVGAALALTMAVAWALPSPKEIEAAVNAGHTSQAETMLREVLQEKPQSAKAHYELGQVLAREARYGEAHDELHKAQELDPTLKFASSPDKFQATLAEVDKLAPAARHEAAPVAVTAMPAAARAEAQAEHGTSLTSVWIGIGVLFLIGLWLLRSRVPAPVPSPVYEAAPPRGFGAQYTPGQPYPPQPGYGYPPAGSGTGSTVAGAVVGGLAGVAAGYALSKAFEGEHHSGGVAPGTTQVADNGGYIPFDQNGGGNADFGSFDAGSGGNSWDSGSDVASSGDDGGGGDW